MDYETDKILERLSVPTQKLMRFLALSNPGVANRYNTLNPAEVGIIIDCLRKYEEELQPLTKAMG